METIVDRIRALCVKNRTSITKIEMELGYANGTIGKWKKAKRRPPLEKVMEVAARLHTTVEYLYTGETDIKKPPGPEAEGQSAIKKEAMEFIQTLSDDELRRFIAMGRAAFEKGDGK